MEFRVHPLPQFVLRDIVERRLVTVGESALHGVIAVSVFLGFRRLNRRLMHLVAKPPALPIRRLMQCNAINPGLQAGFAVKMLHAAEHFQKNILRGIGRVGGIAHHAINQPVNWTLKFTDQPCVGRFRAGFQISHNCGFFRPRSNRACQFSQGGRSRHVTASPDYRIIHPILNRKIVGPADP